MKSSKEQKAGGRRRLYRFFMVLLIAALLPVGAAVAVVMADPADTLKDTWGVEILGIRRTAADYMLDFRYRVLDKEKAKPLFVRKSRPQIIAQESGVRMNVFSSPKTGPLRSSDEPKENRNYFILFANPGRYIQPGDLVTIVIDDFRVENLVVQ
jgi:hypothetical protein